MARVAISGGILNLVTDDAIDETDTGSHQERDERRKPDRKTLVGCQPDAQNGRERQNRADGEVDAGHHDDESLTDSDDSNDRRGKEQVFDVDPRKKYRAGQAQQDTADHEDDDESEILNNLDSGLVAGADLAEEPGWRGRCILRLGIHGVYVL